MSILGWILGNDDRRAADRPEVDAAVNLLVDAMDSRLRLVDGYRRTLAPSIRRALASLRLISAGIPGPLDFSRAGWAGDPLVKALFASPQELVRVFSADASVREFLEAPENAGCEDCCVALFATLESKKVLGFALQGEVVQSDVVRESVSFSAHRLTRPAPSPEGVRQGLLDAGLHYLANQALGQLSDARNQRQLLSEERDLLKQRLDNRTRSGRALDSLLADGVPQGGGDGELADLERRLHGLGAPLQTLDQHLALLCTVLDHVPDHLGLEQEELFLDAMNFRVPDHGGPSVRVSLCRVRAGGMPARVAVIARFPRRELLPREQLGKGLGAGEFYP